MFYVLLRDAPGEWLIRFRRDVRLRNRPGLVPQSLLDLHEPRRSSNCADRQADRARLTTVPKSTVNSMQSVVPAYRVIMGVVIFGAACQGVEQGYWTKQGVSQAQFTADYRRDFQECVREGMKQGPINDGAPETDTIRAKHPSAGRTGSKAYHDCMYVRGYEWIKMEPLVGPNAHGPTAHLARCPEDRVIVDPYGYPHCSTPDQIRPARSVDASHEISLPASAPLDGKSPSNVSQPTIPTDPVPQEKTLSREKEKPLESAPREQQGGAEIRTTNSAREADQRRAFDESLCIQHSQTSLSNPYNTFLQCMEERGWPPISK